MDNSFFRFLNNFEQAMDLQNSYLSELNYDMQIHLKPGEAYSCITNVPNGISFDSQYKAYIVDCNNIILNEVTDNVIIVEFTHSKTGLQQLKLELVNINLDFYTDLVSLRLDHDIFLGESYWSNPFILSNYDIKETSVVAFKHNSELDGTDYKTANIFQVIRLKFYKQKESFSDTQQTYTTINGLKFSGRLIKTKFYEFMFDMCSDFIYSRLQFMLSHDIIYVNGIRVTDKQTFDNADKISDTTNISQNKFKLAVNENDTYDFGYQVFDRLVLEPIERTPLGNYSKTNLDLVTNDGGFIYAKFNADIQVEDSLTISVYKGNTFVGSRGVSDIAITDGNKLIVDISGIDYDGTELYNILISSNSIYTVDFIGKNYFSGYVFGQWTYKVNSGFFNKVFFNNSLFNTN